MCLGGNEVDKYDGHLAAEASELLQGGLGLLPGELDCQNPVVARGGAAEAVDRLADAVAVGCHEKGLGVDVILLSVHVAEGAQDH